MRTFRTKVLKNAKFGLKFRIIFEIRFQCLQGVGGERDGGEVAEAKRDANHKFYPETVRKAGPWLRESRYAGTQGTHCVPYLFQI